MRETVRVRFVPEVGAPFEGVVPFMYLDVKGLVTCAIGNLIDTPDEALSLPWRNGDGSPATRMQIAAEWSYVKSRTDLKLHGGMAYGPTTRLRLDSAGIDLAVGRTLARMDAQLEARFPAWGEWPDDAQLATLSLAWACGAAFHFPKLEAALRVGDFAQWHLDAKGKIVITGGAAFECIINANGNPGVVPRNKKNQTLYVSAAEHAATAPKPACSGVLGDGAIDEVSRAR